MGWPERHAPGQPGPARPHAPRRCSPQSGALRVRPELCCDTHRMPRSWTRSPRSPEEPRRCYRSLWPGGLRLELGPGVPEAEGAVEDEPSGRRVGIRAEVAEALELHGLTDRQFRERRLDQALLEHRLRVGAEVGVEVAASAGIGAGEETVIH